MGAKTLRPRWSAVAPIVLGIMFACLLVPGAALGIATPGSISGLRTLPDGTPESLGSPRIYRLLSGSWGQLSPTTTSFFDGTFLISGLTPGVYRVGVPEVASGAVAYPPAFYGGGRDASAGADITVSSGVETTGRNLQRDTSETIGGDALEPDNSAKQAVTVVPGSGWVEHTSFGQPDADWIKFDAVAGHTYTVETSGSVTYPIWGNVSYTLSDTFISLFAADGTTRLAENDDANDRYSKARWTATVSGPMYARVIPHTMAYSGMAAYAAYTLRLADDSASAGTATLQGTVRDAANHSPLAGAWLQIDNVDTGDSRDPIVRADGTYSISGLTAGHYNVVCLAVGYITTQTAGPIVIAEGESAHLDLDVTAAASSAGAVRGSIMHSTGGAAEGASVVLDAGGTSLKHVVDSSGYFGFEDVEVGQHTVTITEPGYAPATRTVRVGASNGDLDGPVVIETLFPAGVVKGVVRSGGVGLVGVTVSANDTSTVTGFDGSYVLSGVLTGPTNVTFSKASYVSAVLGVSVSQGATSTLDASLAHPKAGCVISRSPSAGTVTYKRKKGSAKFTLKATLTGIYGPYAGSPVWLQYSSNGKTGWKNIKLSTNSAGVVSRTITAKKKATTYYRWYTPATSAHTAAQSKNQKVVVK